MYKTARVVCKIPSDYDNIDLTDIPSEYRPRTNYLPGDKERYLQRIPKWEGLPISMYFRVAARKMISIAMERTLIPCLLPHGYLHTNAIISFSFKSARESALVNGLWASLPFDWFVRSTGKPNFTDTLASLLPVFEGDVNIEIRSLLLNCVSSDYKDLWRGAWNETYLADGWLSSDPRLTNWSDHLMNGSKWGWETPLRTQLDRRQALVELDVIVTKALGLSLDDLLLMYRVSFPTMRKYDADTFYDQNGRCVFSAKSGESYLSRQEWESIKDMKDGEFKKTITETVFSDTPTERTITYKAPFFKKNREADYKEAWEMLEKRNGNVM